jgi:hypothetical protein
MTMTEEEPTTPSNLVPIAKNMYAVWIHVRRPSMRPASTDAEVTVKGHVAQVGDFTPVKWRADTHEIWRKIDATRGEIKAAADYYSIADAMPGYRLISIFKYPDMERDVMKVVAKRMELAEEYDERWWDIYEHVQKKYPTDKYGDVFEEQIKPILPKKGEMRNLLSVSILPYELTMASDESLDLADLDWEEKRKLVDRKREQYSKLMDERFGKIIDGVFGEALTLAEEIATGQYTFNRKKEAGIEELLHVLEKVTYFRNMIGDTQVLERIDSVSKQIKSFNIGEINKSEQVQKVIREAFTPLAEVLRAQTQTRARRTVST